jgi:hypothetical protein
MSDKPTSKMISFFGAILGQVVPQVNKTRFLPIPLVYVGVFRGYLLA